MSDFDNTFPKYIQEISENYFNYKYSPKQPNKFTVNLDEKKVDISESEINELLVIYSDEYQVYETMTFFLFNNSKGIFCYLSKIIGELIFVTQKNVTSYFEIAEELFSKLIFAYYYSSLKLSVISDILTITNVDDKYYVYIRYRNVWHIIYESNEEIYTIDRFDRNNTHKVVYNFNDRIIYENNKIVLKIDDLEINNPTK